MFERTMSNRGKLIPVVELVVGDSVDLEQDPIADPDFDESFQYETGQVVAIGEDIEGYDEGDLPAGSVLIEFSVDGASHTVAFPADYELTWTNCLELIDSVMLDFDNPRD